MTQEIFDKLQDLLEDVDSKGAASYSSWECDFLSSLRNYSEGYRLTPSQEIKIEEIWDKHLRYKS